MQLAVHTYEPTGPAKQLDNSKPDVVLIHGTGGNAELWMNEVSTLTNMGFRCFLPEFRGHGKSPEPGEITNLSMHSSDIIESLEKHDIRFPAIFIGHSLGAIVTVELATKYPELCEKFLAVSLPVKVPKLTATAFDIFLRGAFHHLRSSKLADQLPPRHRILLQTEWHSLNQILTNFAELNLEELVPQVSCPTHLAYGRFDPVAPYRYAKGVHKAMPHSTMRIFDWAGHNIMDDQPKLFENWLADKINN